MPWLRTDTEVCTATDAFPSLGKKRHMSPDQQMEDAQWCRSVPSFVSSYYLRIWTIYDAFSRPKKGNNQIFCTVSLKMFFHSRLKTKRNTFISQSSAVPLKYLVCALFLLKALEWDDKSLRHLSLRKQVPQYGSTLSASLIPTLSRVSADFKVLLASRLVWAPLST